MEGDTERDIMHCSNHEHPLILKVSCHEEGDFDCKHCEKEILCKTSVYTCDAQNDDEECAAFFLHKNCADLPIRFLRPRHKHLLKLVSLSDNSIGNIWEYCSVCGSVMNYKKTYAYDCDVCQFKVCLKCHAIPLQETTIQHWSHQHRPLRFMERCATFKCDACNTVATDSSYRCDDYTCPFWIHMTCANLPQLNVFGIHHKHPLQLSDSLPKAYCGFTEFCKICKKEVMPSRWLYYCGMCRFFAHIRCTLSTTPVLRRVISFDDPALMHLPAPDERSMNLMLQKCIKDIISLSVDITEEPPSAMAHGQHSLALKGKSAVIITDDDSNQVSERLIICDGCTKPIIPSLDDGDAFVFYECSKCNFFLHRYCAQFPDEIDHQLLGMLQRVQPGVIRSDMQRCCNCNVYSNGLMFKSEFDQLLDIWCVCLPEKVIHSAHHHPLEQHFIPFHLCNVCHQYISGNIVLGCKSCNFFIHQHCALKPVTLNHRWDPHPLRLVLSVEDDVEDHPHEFECETCSHTINTNNWFYHCNICDLSFHMFCMDPSYFYSKVKFGAANIKIKAHEHELTFVLNKKKRPHCGSCGKHTTGHALLECKPCTFVQHSPDSCCKDSCCVDSYCYKALF